MKKIMRIHLRHRTYPQRLDYVMERIDDAHTNEN